MTLHTEITPNYSAIKAKQNAAWASGDYAVIGTTLQIVGENLAERLDLTPGATVLDVAAGNGNASLAFARRWHKVTSSDYVGDLLDKGAARAKAEGLEIAHEIADAEALPFPDNSFDGVVSTFGVMFAPNQHAAASEMFRVTKPGGQIGMANWTSAGFIGQLFKVLGSYIAPPAGVKPPSQWGDPTWLAQAFAQARAIKAEPRNFMFRYQSPAHFVEVFRTLYGPVHKAFLALDTAQQQALEQDICSLIEAMNTAQDGSVRVPAEYLEIAITK